MARAATAAAAPGGGLTYEQIITWIEAQRALLDARAAATELVNRDVLADTARRAADGIRALQQADTVVRQLAATNGVPPVVPVAAPNVDRTVQSGTVTATPAASVADATPKRRWRKRRVSTVEKDTIRLRLLRVKLRGPKTFAAERAKVMEETGWNAREFATTFASANGKNALAFAGRMYAQADSDVQRKLIVDLMVRAHDLDITQVTRAAKAYAKAHRKATD